MSEARDPLTAHFVAMAENNRWANARLGKACVALSDAAFAAERVGFFPSLRQTLGHILEVDRYYLDALEEGGEGLAVFARALPTSARDMVAEQAVEDARLIGFCEGLRPTDHAREVITDRGEDGRIAERVDALLPHLFQHQIHHRGQAHAMLAGTDVPPPQLDEFFLRFDRAPDAPAI